MNYCKKCAYPIVWKQTDKGWRPFNENGTAHFDTCKQTVNSQKILAVLKNKKPERLQIGENEFV